MPSSVISANVPDRVSELSGQEVRKNWVVNAIAADPAMPATRPASDTPPFVPGGTVRRVVISLGLLRERIPSSEESVSDVVAA